MTAAVALGAVVATALTRVGGIIVAVVVAVTVVVVLVVVSMMAVVTMMPMTWTFAAATTALAGFGIRVRLGIRGYNRRRLGLRDQCGSGTFVSGGLGRTVAAAG